MACVYIHTRLDKNIIFYVGVGKSTKRAFNKVRRSDHWKSVVKKTKYKIDILYDNIDYEEALIIENKLIIQYGRHDLGLGELVNKTDGGRGGIGMKRPDLSLYNKTRINPLKGKKRPPEFGENLSKLKKGVKRPDVTLRLKGKKTGPNPWVSISNSKRKGIPLKRGQCQYCHKYGVIRTLKPNHFENCDMKDME